MTKDYSSYSDEELEQELSIWGEVNPIITNSVRAERNSRALQGKKKEKPKPQKPKGLTEEEVFDLNKDEQVALLEKLGADKIPRYEKDRVKLILKLQ